VINFFRVQRLFATFPDGQPGAALLLLRLALAGILAFRGPLLWQGPPAFLISLLCNCTGLFLAVGIFTPFTAMVAAALGAAALLLCRSSDPASAAFVVVVMAALVLLGAGAYSLDARLYGRREVVVQPRREF
jgi:putative oxidoreductase